MKKTLSEELTNAVSPGEITRAITMSLFAELISKSQERIDVLAVKQSKSISGISATKKITQILWK